VGAEIRITQDGVLCCPWCGEDGEYLHHQCITVYERGEDAERVTVTRVSPDKPPRIEIIPSRESDNPSARRNGLAIAFWCESCQGVSELTIAQHKGFTHLDWRKSKLEMFGTCGCGSPIEGPGRETCFKCYCQQQG